MTTSNVCDVCLSWQNDTCKHLQNGECFGNKEAEQFLCKKMKWIKCTDQNPPPETLVLGYGKNFGRNTESNIDVISYMGEPGCFLDECGTEINGTIWTHWMPLPEPPKD